MIELTNIDEIRDRIAFGITVVLFGHYDNPAYRMQIPMMKEMETEPNFGVRFFNVSITDNSTLSVFGIKKIPTLIVFKAGKEISREENITVKAVIREMILAAKGKKQ